ncbi:MAG: universal stress protein, partial [Dehalococcoidia bacterium]
HVHTDGGLDDVRFTEQQIESMKAEAKEYLDRVSEGLAGTKGMVRSEVGVGDTAHGIIKFADEANIRLITISSHGRSGIRQWISGSVTQKILHAGNTPVLLVKALGIKA